MRDDLLAYLERLKAGPSRRIYRAERWRHRWWTTRHVAAVAGAVARALVQREVQAGDRVGIFLNDGPLWVAGFFGILRTGAVAVPLDVAIPREILRQAAQQLELKAWLTEREVPALDLPVPAITLDWRRRLAGSAVVHGADGGAATPPPWPDPDPEGIAQIVLTSGTSGVPQAVPIKHRNVRAVLDPVAEEVERYSALLRLLPAGRIGVALPLSHLYGQVMGVFIPALFNAHTFMIPALSGPELAQLIRDERISVLSTVPRTLSLLARTLIAAGEQHWGAQEFHRRLEAAEHVPGYRRPRAFAPVRRLLGRRFVAVVSGGAALDRDVEDLWRRLGYVVVQGYGLTEAAPMVTLNHPFHTRAGSLGKPLRGVQVRVADDGEILVRGANVVSARIGGAAVDDEGWLHTGDLGRTDEEGRLYYLGRKGDRIVTPAGVNVDPQPMIAALRLEEGILDAVVLERPWGSRGVIAAVVLPRPGADVERAVRSLNATLPDAARIRMWFAWPGTDLPRTHTGKVRRAEVRRWLLQQGPAGAADNAAPAPAVEEQPAEPADGAASRVAAARAPSTTRSTSMRHHPFAAVAALVAEITGDDPTSLEPATPIVDALTSLDRVELATHLEATYGVSLSDTAFEGERTLGDLAADLAGAEPAAARPAAIELAAPRAPGDGAEQPAAPFPLARASEENEAEEPPTDAGTASPRSPRTTTGTTIRPHEVFPEYPWRTHPVTRAARFVVRELVMHPWLRAVVKLDGHGLEHLADLEPPFLLASNHMSIMDPVCLMFALPYSLRTRVAPTAMWQHFESSESGSFQYWAATVGLNLFPLVQVGDWRPTLRVAGRLADRGYCPLIFPEGARTLDGELLDFRLGIGVIAQHLHLPIVPCAIAGLLAVLPAGARWLRSGPIPRPRVAVHFGTPVAAPLPADDPRTTVEELRKRIAALLPDARMNAGRS